MYPAAVKCRSKRVYSQAEFDAEIVELEVPAETNQLLRYFGFRIASFLPCSFDCKRALRTGSKIAKSMRKIDSEALDWLLEALRLPLEWDSYRGLVEVRTPLFIGLANTSFKEHRKIIRVL